MRLAVSRAMAEKEEVHGISNSPSIYDGFLVEVLVAGDRNLQSEVAGEA